MGNTTELIGDTKAVRNSLLACTTTLNATSTALVALVERIELRLQELEEKEESFKVLDDYADRKRKETDEQLAKLEEKHKKLEEKERKLNQRADLLLNLENKLNETQERMLQNAAKFQSLITLSVGGTRFVVPKANLMAHKESLFVQMLTTDHSQERNGEFYIDYSPKHFQHVLDYLRDGSIDVPAGAKDELKKYFLYFRLPDPSVKEAIGEAQQNVFEPQPPQEAPGIPQPLNQPQEPPKFEGGDLLSPQLKLPFKSWLPNSSFSLIYKGSRDGFTAKNFHSKCDQKGATITVIKSTDGFLFGGYSATSWSTSLFSSTAAQFETFLFSLTNPHNLPPTSYAHIPGAPGANSSQSVCAVFGEKVSLWGKVKHDLYLPSNANKGSYFINFPQCYEDTTGKGDKTFTGQPTFTAADVEVYLVTKFM